MESQHTMKDGCHQCRKTEPEAQLTMCRVCHKQFCEDHCTRRGGVAFCSIGCGFFFFHDDEESVEE
jgi:hypothetical protein